jgi:hydrogenase nickel incorporation protein HypA/HybF
VSRLVVAHEAIGVTRIRVAIGPLSGVEAPLFKRAFAVARAGTVAAEAKLELEPSPLLVRCTICDARGEAAPNRLLCPVCGDWRVEVVQGDALLLTSVELSLARGQARESGTTAPSAAGTPAAPFA